MSTEVVLLKSAYLCLCFSLKSQYVSMVYFSKSITFWEAWHWLWVTFMIQEAICRLIIFKLEETVN